MEFHIFSIWYNVKFYTVLTPKMIWEPLNCGSVLDNIYLGLHEKVLEISFKNSLRENMSILDQRYKLP